MTIERAPQIPVAGPPCGTLPRGQVFAHTLAPSFGLDGFLYLPRRTSARPPLFISVHGIARNAAEHAFRFAAEAERHGIVLMAPLFARPGFRRYQQFGLGGSGQRADRALAEAIAEVARLTGADAAQVYLFGFSGGGQFVHRYAMANPDTIARVAVGAAGWYSLPDPEVAFPLGIGPCPGLDDLSFDPERFLRLPFDVLVGERDTIIDHRLNQAPEINALQGRTRLERAERWVEAMTRAARERSIAPDIQLVRLPGVGHSFSHAMRRRELDRLVFERLFRPRAPASPQAGRCAQ